MEYVVLVGVISYFCLCLVVGWVSEKRGRGSALGFWLSLFFSPVIGLLVLLALGGANGDNSDGSSAALEWDNVSGSLDVREYEDFAQAFPGTKEAYTALKQKRLVEEWHRLDKTDGQVVEEFFNTVSFPELSAQVRAVVERNAAFSASVAAYLERLHAEERLAIELVEKERELQAVQVARSRKNTNQTMYITAGIATAIAVLWLLYGWSDQNNTRRILQEAGIDLASIDLNSRCADQEVSLLLAEVSEREDNAELRNRIQILDTELYKTESPASSAEKGKLTQELSQLRNQLFISQPHRDLSAARDRFYACQSAAGK